MNLRERFHELILETPHWEVFLNNEDQIYLGRCYVSAKSSAGTLSELTAEEMADFHSLAISLESALKNAFGAKMFNWTCLMNNAYRKDPPSPHVHWHLRPRYDKEVKLGEKTFADPNFASHYQRGPKQPTEAGLSKIIAQEIRIEL